MDPDTIAESEKLEGLYCGTCDRPLADDFLDSGLGAYCGAPSRLRTISVSMTASLSITPVIGFRTTTGRRIRSGDRKRPAQEHTSGEFVSKSPHGRTVRVDQRVDRESGWYFKCVVDTKTCDVLRFDS